LSPGLDLRQSRSSFVTNLAADLLEFCESNGYKLHEESRTKHVRRDDGFNVLDNKKQTNYRIRKSDLKAYVWPIQLGHR
jgi:hypothetical protein